MEVKEKYQKLSEKLFFISPKGPYDLNQSARFFGRFDDAVDVWTLSGRKREINYKRVLLNENREPVIVKVFQNGKIDRPKLMIEAIKGEITLKTLETLDRMFRIDDGLKDFYIAAKTDSVMSRLVNTLYGLKPTMTPTVFEMIVIAISEQQIALKTAVKMRNRLAVNFGSAVRWNGRKYYSFPDAGEIAKLHTDDLVNISFPKKRAEAILEVANIQSKEFDFEEMFNLSNDEVINILTNISGIGHWTAEYVLARGLGRLDVYPANDLAVKRAIKFYYGDKTSDLEKWGANKRFAEYYLLFGYALKENIS